MSKEAYLAETYKQLTDSRYYHKLDEDPTQDHADRVNVLLQEMSDNGHLQKDTKSTSPHTTHERLGSTTYLKYISQTFLADQLYLHAEPQLNATWSM